MGYISRSIVSELNKLIDKRITVRLVDGRSYTGKLISYDQSALHLVLSDAESNEGEKFHRVIIAGNRISEIIVVEHPVFDAEEFASILTSKLNLRPDVVRVVPEINAVIVYDRIKITEAGVEGAGSLAQRIYEIYNEYIESKRRGGS